VYAAVSSTIELRHLSISVQLPTRFTLLFLLPPLSYRRVSRSCRPRFTLLFVLPPLSSRRLSRSCAHSPVERGRPPQDATPLHAGESRMAPLSPELEAGARMSTLQQHLQQLHARLLADSVSAADALLGSAAVAARDG
jgi:hypothetical protein